MRLEVVTTTFNSERTILEFLKRLDKSLCRLDCEVQTTLTIVDDGSTDRTIECIQEFDKSELRNIAIRLVELSRNFGHHKAILEGLDHFADESELLLVIDSDGEEDPEELSRMISIMDKDGSDLVIAFQARRTTGKWSRLLAGVAEFVLKLFSPNDQVSRVCTLRLLKKSVVESIQAQRVSEPVLAYIDAQIGFKKSYFQVQRKFKGSSQYTFKRRFKLFLSVLFYGTEFIKISAAILSLCGVLMAFVVCLALIYYRLTLTNPLTGFTTTNLMIAGFSGIIIALLSTVTYLVSRVLNELGSRPRTIVRRVTHFRD